MVNHHLPLDLLLAHAAGTLGDSESLLVACHITLCPTCRAVVDDAEAVGGALLSPRSPESPSGTDPDPASSSALARMLARLDEADDGDPEPASSAGPFDPTGLLPAPLYRLTGPLDQQTWQTPFPGVELTGIPALRDGRFVHLTRVQPALEIPRHRHPGFEATLVLAGGFRDDDGQPYARGDVCVRDETRPHQQWVDPGEPCVWLLVAFGAFILDPGD